MDHFPADCHTIIIGWVGWRCRRGRIVAGTSKNRPESISQEDISRNIICLGDGVWRCFWAFSHAEGRGVCPPSSVTLTEMDSERPERGDRRQRRQWRRWRQRRRWRWRRRWRKGRLKRTVWANQVPGERRIFSSVTAVIANLAMMGND